MTDEAEQQFLAAVQRHLEERAQQLGGFTVAREQRTRFFLTRGEEDTSAMCETIVVTTAPERSPMPFPIMSVVAQDGNVEATFCPPSQFGRGKVYVGPIHNHDEAMKHVHAISFLLFSL